MPTTVLSAFPCAPRVGERYAALSEVLVSKLRTLPTRSGGMPGPLSETVNSVVSLPTRACMSTLGATPAVSQASSELSTSSLKTTVGKFSRRCPVCVCSSRTSKYSAAREVSKVVRSSLCITNHAQYPRRHSRRDAPESEGCRGCLSPGWWRRTAGRALWKPLHHLPTRVTSHRTSVMTRSRHSRGPQRIGVGPPPPRVLRESLL